VGNAFSRSAPLLLIPVFTRFLSPADYGVIAVATAVGSLLSMVFLLSLDSALTVMYFHQKTDYERRRLNSSLLACWLLLSGVLALSLDIAGQEGYLNWLSGLPFHPYLRLVVWTSYLSIFATALQTVYTTTEKPIRAVGLGLAQMLITVSASIYLVVSRRLGTEGVITANFIGAALVGSASFAGFALLSKARPSWAVSRRALHFGLPLVPHVGATWALNLSDRTILQHYVAETDVGIYALGYQVGSIIMLLTHGISYAFYPLFNAQMVNEDGRRQVPVLGTYAMIATVTIGLAIALLGGDLIRGFTPPHFHPATRVVPWVAVGCTFQGVYYIWSRGTWFSMQTRWVPLITGFSAALNVILNLITVPRFGYMAAAVNTAVAFAVLAGLHGFLAHRVFPIAWEYVRWRKLGLAAGVILLIGMLIPATSLAWRTTAHLALLVAAFPGLLAAMGFFTTRERQLMKRLWVPIA
jgi:O-antigen/teichoic acid export membrane protein